MAILLARSALSEFADRLVELFPGSLHAYNIIRNTAEGVLEREVWVDKWPQFTALLIKPTDNDQGFEVESLTIFKTPESNIEGCVSLIRNPAILDWNMTLNFGGIDPCVKVELDRAAREHKCKTTIIGDAELMVATRDTLPETIMELPMGIKQETGIKLEEVPYLSSKWPYIDVVHDTEQYTRFLITNFPSMALRLQADSSALVGWVTLHTYGALAMLYVEPEFRGQGLGKYLTQKIAKIAVEKGTPVYLVVERANVVAQQMYTKCGFYKSNVFALWFRYEPEVHLSKDCLDQ